jgi:hypothetical protein
MEVYIHELPSIGPNQLWSLQYHRIVIFFGIHGTRHTQQPAAMKETRQLLDIF